MDKPFRLIHIPTVFHEFVWLQIAHDALYFLFSEFTHKSPVQKETLSQYVIHVRPERIHRDGIFSVYLSSFFQIQDIALWNVTQDEGRMGDNQYMESTVPGQSRDGQVFYQSINKSPLHFRVKTEFGLIQHDVYFTVT